MPVREGGVKVTTEDGQLLFEGRERSRHSIYTNPNSPIVDLMMLTWGSRDAADEYMDYVFASLGTPVGIEPKPLTLEDVDEGYRRWRKRCQ